MERAVSCQKVREGWMAWPGYLLLCFSGLTCRIRGQGAGMAGANFLYIGSGTPLARQEKGVETALIHIFP